MRSRAGDSDSGFTLIELLLVTAIVGLVVPALAGVLLVYLRTAFVASTRSDRAHDSNLLASYLQPDLASIRIPPSLSGTSCMNTAVFTWSEQAYVPNGNGTTHTYVATYAVSAAAGADAPFSLRRTLTVDGTSAGSVPIAHNLDTSCGASFSVNGSKFTATVIQSDASGNAEPSTLKFTGSTGGRT